MLGRKDERCICSGQINEIIGFDFKHTLDSRSSSSGSPICLKDNKCVVGIHKQDDLERPVNYGIFLGIILDNLENNESNEVIEEKKEHEFHFSNIKSIGQIKNEENIQSVLLLDEKYVSAKDKFLIVKSERQVCVYFLESKKLKFKVSLDSENFDDSYSSDFYDDRYDIIDKLEIVDNKYYKELPQNSFLLITKKYKIEIDLDNNKGRIIDTIYNYFKNLKTNYSYAKIPYNIIKSGEFISNLDVFCQGNDLEYTRDTEEYFIFFLNKNFHLEKKIEKSAIGRTFEINGKYFIHYFYWRGGSTTSVYDINNNYQQVYEKRYYHQGNLSFVDNYLILPPSQDAYFEEYCNYTFVNLQNFSDRLIEISHYYYGDEPMIVHKFNGEKYLQCKSPGFWNELIKNDLWTIIEEKEGKFIQKEKANDDNILGDNLLFFKNNVIISWNFNGNIITFLIY